jgi:hypothetical protein
MSVTSVLFIPQSIYFLSLPFKKNGECSCCLFNVVQYDYPDDDCNEIIHDLSFPTPHDLKYVYIFRYLNDERAMDPDRKAEQSATTGKESE